MIGVVGFSEVKKFIGASTFGGRLTELISPIFVVVWEVDLEGEK